MEFEVTQSVFSCLDFFGVRVCRVLFHENMNEDESRVLQLIDPVFSKLSSVRIHSTFEVGTVISISMIGIPVFIS